jgi:hypothetical protein
VTLSVEIHASPADFDAAALTEAIARLEMGHMADVRVVGQSDTGPTSAPPTERIAMTASARPTSASPVRSRRRLGALVLVTLTLVGAAAPLAYGEPDTNIQKPGHVAVLNQ